MLSWRRLLKEVSNHLPRVWCYFPANIHPGVTIVQYRDKKSDTAVQVETAKKLHGITRAYNVPLLINDRVDVALAAGVEGVHLGQDDMRMPLFNGIEES